MTRGVEVLASAHQPLIDNKAKEVLRCVAVRQVLTPWPKEKRVGGFYAVHAFHSSSTAAALLPGECGLANETIACAGPD